MDALKDATLKISTQIEEIMVHLVEMKENIAKQRTESLHDRMAKMESSTRDIHIKLDALNAIDINPTIEAPRPAQVRVAGAKKKDDDVKEAKEAKEAKEDDEEDGDDPPLPTNITEYFKFLWVKYRDMIYEKGVYSKKEYDDFYELNREEYDKKGKKNEMVLQKSIGYKIWRTLSDDRKDIVRSMKDQHAKNIGKKASKDVEEEVEEEEKTEPKRRAKPEDTPKKTHDDQEIDDKPKKKKTQG